METSLDKGLVTWKFYKTVSTYKCNTKISHVKQELLNQTQASNQFLATTKLSTNKEICL